MAALVGGFRCGARHRSLPPLGRGEEQRPALRGGRLKEERSEGVANLTEETDARCGSMLVTIHLEKSVFNS